MPRAGPLPPPDKDATRETRREKSGPTARTHPGHASGPGTPSPARPRGLPGPVHALLQGGTWTKKHRKSTRLNSSHANISYAVFCLKKKNNKHQTYSLLQKHDA